MGSPNVGAPSQPQGMSNMMQGQADSLNSAKSQIASAASLAPDLMAAFGMGSTSNPILQGLYDMQKNMFSPTQNYTVGGLAYPYQQAQNQFNTAMENNLGPGWQSSTSGSQAWNNFNNNWASIFNQNFMQNLSGMEGVVGQTLGNIMSPNLTMANANMNLASGFGNATQPYLNQEQLNQNAQIATANNWSNLYAGLAGGGGAAAGGMFQGAGEAGGLGKLFMGA